MKSATLGKKVGTGFAGLIALSVILSGIAVVSMLNVESSSNQLSREFIPETGMADRLYSAVADANLSIRSYGLTADKKYLDEYAAKIVVVHDVMAEAHTMSSEHPALVKLRAHLDDLDSGLRGYEASIAETVAKNNDILAGRAGLDASAATFVENMEKVIRAQNDSLDAAIAKGLPADKLIESHKILSLATGIRAQGNQGRILAYKAQALRNTALFDDGLKLFDQMDADFAELKSALKVQSSIDQLEVALASAHAYRDRMRRLQDDMVGLNAIGVTRLAFAQKLASLALDTAATGMQRTIDAAQTSNERLAFSSRVIVGGLVLSFLGGVAVAWVIIRSTGRAIGSVTTSVESGSDQLAAAAAQMSDASSQLANGASEQAASLEETSASIEEMSSMTKRTAQNAQNAKSLASETRQVADAGAANVGRMSEAMREMKSSNGEISNIIKTIDEIAFQTNILALNAAVEAARAGEAGAGFAVVADEVRALARRCASAARETSEKIANALQRSEEGVSISTEVAGTLGNIVERIRRVDEIVAEIAQASTEQAAGVEQINKAVSQIDKITQSNAASAEETAAASEELNAQAVELSRIVVALKALAGGTQRPTGKTPERALLPDRRVRMPSPVGRRMPAPDFVLRS